MALTAVMIGSPEPTEVPGIRRLPAHVEPPGSAGPISSPGFAPKPFTPSGSIRDGSEPLSETEIPGGEGLKRLPAEALAKDFPEIELSEDSLSGLNEAVAAIRESLSSLRAVERTPETAAALEELEERRDAALLEFERITGVPFQEFMRSAPQEGGIDEEDADADGVVLLPISPRP